MPPFPEGVPELAKRVLIADESDVPLKQYAVAAPVQEEVTAPVDCDFRKPSSPSRM